MDTASYLSLSQGLADETRDIPEAPQIDDVVQDGKRFVKTGLEGLGSQLSGHSIIKKLSGKAKKALNLSDDELKELQSKVEAGDYEGAVGKIFRNSIKQGSAKIEQAVNSAVGKGDIPTSKADLSKAARRAARAAKKALKKKAQPDEAGPAEEPQGEDDLREAMNRLLGRNRPIPQQQPQELSALKSNDNPFTRDTSVSDRPQGAYGPKAPAAQQEDRAPAENQTEPARDPDAIQPAEKDAIKQGEKEVEQQVEKKTLSQTLKDTAVESTAEDETPIGGIVTAALGVAALVTGLMTHDHKKVWKKPPVRAPSINYSIQSGVE